MPLVSAVHPLRRRAASGLAALLVALTLSGCATPQAVATQPIEDGGVLPLVSGGSLGQSFVAAEGGLSGVEFRLATEGTPGPAQLSFDLRHSALDATPLISGSMALPGQTDGAGSALRITFPAQPSTRQQDYYLSLQYVGPPGYALKTGPAGSYVNGAAYVDGVARESQLAFALVHDPVAMAVGHAAFALQTLWLLFAGVLVLVVPGLAVLLSLPAALRRTAGLFDLLSLSPALSLAAYPMLLVAAELVHVQPGPVMAWGPILVALGVIVWQLRRNPGLRPRRPSNPADWALLGLFGLVIVSRLWGIRGLEAAMNRDAIHHTVLTQLILDHRGLFSGWQPYAEMTSLTYHIGFHSASAALAWVMGQASPQATLWMGQLLNIAAVVALVPLARAMTRSTWAAVAALLLAGLLSEQPGFFVNWSRYTQLAGQVALTGIMALVWTVIDAAIEHEDLPLSRRATAVLGVAWAAVAYGHYRMLIFAITFLVSAVAVGVWRMRARRNGLIMLAGGAMLGALLFAPWLLRIFSGEIANVGARMLSTPADQVSDFVAGYNGAPDPLGAFPSWARLVVPLAVGVAMWRRNRHAVAVLLWWALTLLAVNPQWLRLPGAGLITNFTLNITAFVPVGLLIGCMLAAPTRDQQPPRPRAMEWMAAALALGLGLIGTTQRLNDIQSDKSAILFRPDVRAFAWIRANLPTESVFAVRAYPIHGGGMMSGSDGGWWLPLFTKRTATLPPENYSMERPPDPGYVERINGFANRMREGGLNPANIAEMRAAGVTHIYVGQGRFGGDYMFDPAALDANPAFKAVYRQDRVRIYALLP